MLKPPAPPAKSSKSPANLGACPICGRTVTAEFRPFCSRRCADVDLGRWFRESYRVPARPDPESGDDETG
jgi:endogenous inhibitor of DNA gyrase (YacG/DUF329 family)